MLIPRRSPSCLKCETSFNQGADYLSLIEYQKEKILREDLCTKCFETIDDKQSKTYWKGKIPLRRSKKMMSRNEKAHLLLRELLADGSAESQKLCYHLCLYLVRKKELQLRERGGFSIFTIVESDEELIFKRPSLSEEETAEILKDLVERIG